MDEPRSHWLEDIVQDLSYTLRTFLQNLGLPIVAGLTLALGVGATTAVFSLTKAILRNDLGLDAHRGLLVVQERRTNNVHINAGLLMLPYERILAYREGTKGVFSGLAAHTPADFSLRTESEARAVLGSRTTANYFEVLGLQPVVGRFYANDTDQSVVLNFALWRDQFGSDREVVGRTVYLDSKPYTIAGVAPEGFYGTVLPISADLWVPVRAHLTAEEQPVWLSPFARLAPGVEPTNARAVTNTVALSVPPAESSTRVAGAQLAPLTGLGPSDRGLVARFLNMLLAMATLVLLIGSANIAGLLIARGMGRRREIAVRLALGASRARLVRLLLTESVILFVLGGLIGLALAFAITRMLSTVSLPSPFRLTMQLTPDLTVLGFGLAVAAVTGIVFGLVPALQSTNPTLLPAIKEGTGGIGLARTRGLFVTGQVALSVLLLVTTGLFVRSTQRALAQHPGFDPENVVIATVDLNPHGYDEARGRLYFQQLVERVKALPGVQSVGLSSIILLGGSLSGDDVRTAEPGPGGIKESDAGHALVEPGYFATMRVPMRTGRTLTDADRLGSARVAVINETMARRLWPNENPIGKRVRTQGEVYEVVGVAQDGRYVFMQEEQRAFMFEPFAQDFSARMTLHVRTSDQAQTLAGMREHARAIDPNVALIDPSPLPRVVGISLLPLHFAAWLIGGFGLIGLVLAAVGIYGVLASYVVQRYREFGIRIAIGATAGRVVTLVVGRAARMALLGAGIGVLLAFFLTRFLESMLFGISARDLATFVTVPLVLGGVALVASYIPARRATRIDPIVVLRSD